MVEEEETVKHLLCECNSPYSKIIATIDRRFPEDVSEVAQIKLFVQMTYIRSTGWFRRETIESGDISPGGIIMGFLNA